MLRPSRARCSGRSLLPSCLSVTWIRSSETVNATATMLPGVSVEERSWRRVSRATSVQLRNFRCFQRTYPARFHADNDEGARTKMDRGRRPLAMPSERLLSESVMRGGSTSTESDSILRHQQGRGVVVLGENRLGSPDHPCPHPLRAIRSPRRGRRRSSLGRRRRGTALRCRRSRMR